MESCVSIQFVPSDGEDWAGYLYQKLTVEYDIHCEQMEFSADSVTQTQNSVLNVFFVTPDFLTVQDWSWARSVNKNRCILVLTGTDLGDLEYSVQTHDCDYILEFYIFEIKNTEESVRRLLLLIISKYEDNDLHRTGSLPTPHSTKISVPVHHAESIPRDFKFVHTGYRKSSEQASIGVAHSPKSSSPYVQEETGLGYDFLPKYPRQVNGVRDVLYANDKLYLLLWRRAEGTLKVKLQDDEISPVCTECAVYELPYEGRQSCHLTVVQEGETIGEKFIKVPDSTESGPAVIESSELPQNLSQSKSCAQTSVSTQTDASEIDENRSIISESHADGKTRDSLYVNIDDVARDSSEITWEKSGKSKLDYIREILQAETDPEEMLCQCLGIDKGVKYLDEKMTSMVQSVETLKHLSFSGKISTTEEKETSTWPTLVHFGAQFNLVNFCDVLLSNPLMYGACVRKNKDGHMPHDIARIHGHMSLADMLEHFSEFVTAAKERDSGISSGWPSTPRLSTITMSSEPPPRPHKPSKFGSSYVDMTLGQVYDPDMGEGQNKQSRKVREVSELSKDGGFCEALESDDDYLPMTSNALFKDEFWSSTRDSSGSSNSSVTARDSLSTNSSFTACDSESTHSSLTARDSGSTHSSLTIHDSDHDRDTITSEDGESLDVEHHKDVLNMLGLVQQPAVFPDIEKKTKLSRLRNIFKGKQNRSKSEPFILSSDLLTTKRNKSTKSYRRESERSSSSTASTYSESSLREEEGGDVQLRGSKHTGAKKTKGILRNAKQNRKSMRIQRVLAETEIKAPALPYRQEMF